MSIHYGRSLPKAPRPKPPQPKLGEIGALRGVARAQRRRKKAKRSSPLQSSSSNSSQAINTSAQQQKPTKQKKRKPTSERPKQNTPVRVELVGPARPPLPSDPAMFSRVVVEWRRAGRRYVAWGKKGVKAVHGWRECSDDTKYQRLLKKLHPIGTKLNITDSRVPVVEILDLIIATGKVLRPKQIFTSSASAVQKPLLPRQAQSRSRSGSRRDQGARLRRSAAAEVARNEVLVIRPSNEQLSKSSRRRKASTEAANHERKRREMLAQQRRGLSRLSWLRRNGYEDRDAPDDMMHVALQGGSPGLKR
jgi:hypothetical protein